MAEMAPDTCAYYRSAVEGGYPVADSLLRQDWPNGTGCLIHALEAMKATVASKGEDSAADPDWDKFVRIAGLLRTIFVNNAQDASGKAQSNPAIHRYRELSSLDATTALVFAQRSPNDAARLNAAVVLSQTADNQNICVVVDHLYDPKLKAALGKLKPYQLKGRASMLSVVTVVAPWAYKENAQEIEKLYVDYVALVAPDKFAPDLAPTIEVLYNIDARLHYSNDPDANRFKPIPANLDACASYRRLFAAPQP